MHVAIWNLMLPRQRSSKCASYTTYCLRMVFFALFIYNFSELLQRDFVKSGIVSEFLIHYHVICRLLLYVQISILHYSREFEM